MTTYQQGQCIVAEGVIDVFVRFLHGRSTVKLIVSQ